MKKVNIILFFVLVYIASCSLSSEYSINENNSFNELNNIFFESINSQDSDSINKILSQVDTYIENNQASYEWYFFRYNIYIYLKDYKNALNDIRKINLINPNTESVLGECLILIEINSVQKTIKSCLKKSLILFEEEKANINNNINYVLARALYDSDDKDVAKYIRDTIIDPDKKIEKEILEALIEKYDLQIDFTND